VEKEKKTNRKYVIIWVLIILILSVIFRFINIGSHNTEKISAKIEEYLYEKYGEGFVVDRIGLRSSRGQEFYQARIYPRSIIGTNKQWDDYYYGEASLDKKRFSLGEVADSYGEIKRNTEIEGILLQEAKEIFGERVLLKVDQRYEKKNERGNFICYLNPTYEEIKKRIADEPENHRILLELQIYIFNRINNVAEKEMRRKQIFDFVQYLKKEGLYEYLEMGVIFIDERVLAPGYKDFRRKIDRSTKVREKVDEEEVYLPPRALRKEMSELLQKEIDNMSEEGLLASMREIRKDELEDFIKYDMQYVSLVYSFGILEERYSSSITEEERKEKDNRYNSIEKIKLEQPYNFIYKY